MRREIVDSKTVLQLGDQGPTVTVIVEENGIEIVSAGQQIFIKDWGSIKELVEFLEKHAPNLTIGTEQSITIENNE